MNRNYFNQPDGYRETIEKGLAGVQTFRGGLSEGKYSGKEAIQKLKEQITEAEAVVIGAGAGLSTAAGFIYNGERFERYFSDFIRVYRIPDMYSGGFFPYPAKEIFWAYWARYIYINRYMDPPKPVYEDLLSLVKDKEYFVITTNVDHCFQKAGIDKNRLFYTQGDYGLFQSTDPGNRTTFDNEDWVLAAMEAQGFVKNAEGFYEMPAGGVSMRIPTALIPKHPDDGSDVTMNLRSDDSFVEDEGWHKASAAYSDFLQKYEGRHILFLEIGVGGNTPVIIKYPFWQMTNDSQNAFYACMNYSEAVCPKQIEEKSICIAGDAGAVLAALAQASTRGQTP